MVAVAPTLRLAQVALVPACCLLLAAAALLLLLLLLLPPPPPLLHLLAPPTHLFNSPTAPFAPRFCPPMVPKAKDPSAAAPPGARDAKLKLFTPEQVEQHNKNDDVYAPPPPPSCPSPNSPPCRWLIVRDSVYVFASIPQCFFVTMCAGTTCPPSPTGIRGETSSSCRFGVWVLLFGVLLLQRTLQKGRDVTSMFESLHPAQAHKTLDK